MPGHVKPRSKAAISEEAVGQPMEAWHQATRSEIDLEEGARDIKAKEGTRMGARGLDGGRAIEVEQTEVERAIGMSGGTG